MQQLGAEQFQTQLRVLAPPELSSGYALRPVYASDAEVRRVQIHARSGMVGLHSSLTSSQNHYLTAVNLRMQHRLRQMGYLTTWAVRQ